MESPVPTPEENKGPFSPGNMLPWIVLLLAALGMFYFVEKGCNATSATEEPATEINTSPVDTTQ